MTAPAMRQFHRKSKICKVNGLITCKLMHGREHLTREQHKCASNDLEWASQNRNLDLLIKKSRQSEIGAIVFQALELSQDLFVSKSCFLLVMPCVNGANRTFSLKLWFLGHQRDWRNSNPLLSYRVGRRNAFAITVWCVAGGGGMWWVLAHTVSSL